MPRILLFGDSNTYGFRPPDGRWSAELRWSGRLAAALPGWQLIEAGQNGRQISDANPLWPELSADQVIEAYLTRYAPLDGLVLMLGSNDALCHTAEDIAAQLAALLQQLRAAAAPPLLLLAPPWGQGYGRRVTCRLAPLYAAAAQQAGCAFADTEPWGIELDADGGHFSAAGHAAFAARLAPLLPPLFAARTLPPSS